MQAISLVICDVVICDVDTKGIATRLANLFRPHINGRRDVTSACRPERPFAYGSFSEGNFAT
jgi:hypothetical protein